MRFVGLIAVYNVAAFPNPLRGRLFYWEGFYFHFLYESMMKKYVLLIAVLVAVLGVGAVKADVSAADVSAADVAKSRAAAEQGEAWAQHNLGLAYWIGLGGVKQDRRQAVDWFRKAAEQGYAYAQTYLGRAYASGQGVVEDRRQSFDWLRKAAEQGDADAQYAVGLAYWLGEGVDKDSRKKVYWLRKAAEQGYMRAQFVLGLAYWGGIGIGKDHRKAVEWYRKAAEQGDADAQFYLGVAYGNGEGVSKDPRQEVYWLRKAAEQGQMEAQTELGFAYSLGIGVVQDYHESYIWLLIAKASGDEGAQEVLSLITPKLSTSEIRSAQKEAASRFAAIETRANESEQQNNFPNITDIAKPPATANIAQQVFENTWRSVVVIETHDAQGSGVIIRPNIVATNCHVVDNAKRIAVYKSVARRADADNAFAARIRHADKRRDFCLLDVDGLWGIAAPVRKYATLKVGESVYGLGAPKGLDLSLSDGLISQLREIDGNRKIQTNVAISPGSSGGGLFDREGNLIGIMTSKITDESVEGIGFAIPADLVLRE